jgi:Ca2+-transporting ATPase
MWRKGKRLTVPAPRWCPVISSSSKLDILSRADLRLLEAVNLRVEEAALTGESVAVQKNATLTHTADSSWETARTRRSWVLWSLMEEARV